MPATDKAVFFFLDSNLPTDRQPADFFAGRIGLSGSDGTLLRVARRLSQRGFSVHVYNFWWEGVEGTLHFHRTGTVDEFLSQAQRRKPNALVFNYYVGRPAALQIAEAQLPSTRKLLWDQNGADFRFIELTRRGLIDEIIAVSYSAREWFRSTSAFYHTRVIYNLCDDAFLAPEPRRTDGRTVLFVGALRPVKGFHALALAWPEVHRQCRDAELVVAGSDALHARATTSDNGGIASGSYDAMVVEPFKRWASRAGAKVQFLGSISPHELVQWHARAVCCVVNPSAAGAGETFCCSAAEAQLCGDPVVSVHNGSLPEVTAPGTTSLLASPGDHTGLASNVITLLRDAQLTGRMSDAAAKFARPRFDSDAIIAEWERAISGVPTAAGSSFETTSVATRLTRDALRVTRLGDLRRRARDATRTSSAHDFPFTAFRTPGDDDNAVQQ